LGQVLGGSLGGIFGEYLSWRDIFLVFGVVSLAIAALMWRRSHRLPKEQHRTSSPLGLATFKPYYQLMTQAIARTVIIGVFFEGFFVSGAFAYLGAFLKTNTTYLI
jgi:predicted MFS family arabinose efflux permease